MKFRTEIDIPPFEKSIDYSHKIFAIGSCFADAIGGRLRRSKFDIEVNPSGVVFNPASISQTLRRFIEKRYIDPKELHPTAQGWSHYGFHSSLSKRDQKECVDSINRAIEVGHQALVNSDWIIITLGTAWIYRLKESGEIVASCHKQPSSIFVRERMTIDQIVESLEVGLAEVVESKNVILTLSPIRHIADGLAENSLSKATLRVAIEKFVERHPRRVNYFPSYEIFVDDLRDYRFYGEDMVHPSPVGVDYVWERFCRAAISTKSRELIAKVLGVVKAAEHRPFDPTSQAHKEFCRAQLRAISTLCEGINMDKERLYFEKLAE